MQSQSKDQQLFCRRQQTDSNVHIKKQRPRTIWTILKKKRVGGLIVANVKIYYKAVIIKTAQKWVGEE